MWTYQEALPVLKALEEKLIPIGAHASMGGSVLFKGESKKDLDVVIYPHNPLRQPHENKIRKTIMDHFGGEWMEEDDDIYARLVLRLLTQGKRIDFFLMTDV